jgi:hypothetical protein
MAKVYRKNNKKGIKEKSRVRGFFRLNIVNPDGTIAGDSGWMENIITNMGYKMYLCDNIGQAPGSKQIGYVALGTGATPLATDTTLTGEIFSSIRRTAVTYLNQSSKSAQFTATFSSANSFLTATSNLQNIGLYNTTATGDTLFSGNTYVSSACATNQNVNVTYTIAFS